MTVVRGVLLFLAGLLVGANLVYFWMTRGGGRPEPARPEAAAAPTPTSAVPARVPPPAMAPSDVPELARGSAPAADQSRLLVPVQGITADQLSDTFNDARGSDRVHEALDIMAPAGTPVLAVADGPVAKLFDSKAGGLTIYQFDPTGTYAYYYAHLQSYAPGLTEGQVLRRGQVIGYVGSSGNADPAAPHLHFAIFQLGPEKRWHEGTPINPYPLLR